MNTYYYKMISHKAEQWKSVSLMLNRKEELDETICVDNRSIKWNWL
jgi:hypothetical protein